jgi:hypothetical protein
MVHIAETSLQFTRSVDKSAQQKGKVSLSKKYEDAIMDDSTAGSPPEKRLKHE